MTEGSDVASNDSHRGAIDLDDVQIEVADDVADELTQDKLNQSMNSVIRVADDAQSSLDTSIISVIEVKDSEEKDKNDLAQILSADQDGEEAGTDVQAAKVEDENLTLSMNQFELLLSDLKTKHLAEKRMLQCDLSLSKKVIKLMVSCIKSQVKDKQRNDIRML